MSQAGMWLGQGMLWCREMVVRVRRFRGVVLGVRWLGSQVVMRLIVYWKTDQRRREGWWKGQKFRTW